MLEAVVQIMMWCLLGAALLGHLGVMLQALTVGFVATGVIIAILWLLGG